MHIGCSVCAPTCPAVPLYDCCSFLIKIHHAGNSRKLVIPETFIILFSQLLVVKWTRIDVDYSDTTSYSYSVDWLKIHEILKFHTYLHTGIYLVPFMVCVHILPYLCFLMSNSSLRPSGMQTFCLWDGVHWSLCVSCPIDLSHHGLYHPSPRMLAYARASHTERDTWWNECLSDLAGDFKLPD